MRREFFGVVTIPRFLAITNNLKARRAAAFYRSAAKKLTQANVALLKGLVERNSAVAAKAAKRLPSLQVSNLTRSMDAVRREIIKNTCPNIPKLGG